jgi:hypothetical protein
LVGLIFFDGFSKILGLPTKEIILISAITLLYSVTACYLAKQKMVSIGLLRIQIGANWFWTIISILLLFFHYSDVTFFGLVYLILQVFVVGVLAFLEGNQLIKD